MKKNRTGLNDDVIFSIQHMCMYECRGSPEAPEEPEGP